MLLGDDNVHHGQSYETCGLEVGGRRELIFHLKRWVLFPSFFFLSLVLVILNAPLCSLWLSDNATKGAKMPAKNATRLSSLLGTWTIWADTKASIGNYQVLAYFVVHFMPGESNRVLLPSP